LIDVDRPINRHPVALFGTVMRVVHALGVRLLEVPACLEELESDPNFTFLGPLVFENR
jgi:hypothetical protein